MIDIDTALQHMLDEFTAIDEDPCRRNIKPEDRYKFIPLADVANDAEYQAIAKIPPNKQILERYEELDVSPQDDMGYIYLITNLVNGKQYVGQTVGSIKQRFDDHIKRSRYTNPTCLVDKAMKKYGTKNFVVDEIGIYPKYLLNEYEIFWIEQYDTCGKDEHWKGYNWLRGGGNMIRILNEEAIIDEYIHAEKFILELAREHKTDAAVIRKILVANNVQLRNQDETNVLLRKKSNVALWQLDENHNRIRFFDSLTSAGEWACENHVTKAKSAAHAGFTIQTASYSGNKTYGYYWEPDMPYTQEEMKRFQKRRDDKKKKSLIINAGSKCPCCGRPKSGRAKYCQKCAGKMHTQNYNEEAALLSKYNITRKKLKKMIRTMPFRHVGEKLGITDNAVKAWCKRLNLPHKSSYIKTISDEGWENENWDLSQQ